jgi:hypothetical protein
MQRLLTCRLYSHRRGPDGDKSFTPRRARVTYPNPLFYWLRLVRHDTLTYFRAWVMYYPSQVNRAQRLRMQRMSVRWCHCLSKYPPVISWSSFALVPSLSARRQTTIYPIQQVGCFKFCPYTTPSPSLTLWPHRLQLSSSPSFLPRWLDRAMSCIAWP